MREHGVLRRILLVYDEAVPPAGRRTTRRSVGVVAGAAGLVRRFVEGYHEKLEEDFVLPKMEKAGKLVELAKVIRAQHAAGRRLTDAIASASQGGDRQGGQRRATPRDCRSDPELHAHVRRRTPPGRTPSCSRPTARCSRRPSWTGWASASRSKSTSSSGARASRAH